ncbi:zinc finger protein 569-like isoform X2 [Armigeres subalbatus]|uniref:zinc finger protein 569-like isoform X2 n=1 Tax=Armigeres subalbatus TaxID=124917 RepID=UPI002ED0ECC5
MDTDGSVIVIKEEVDDEANNEQTFDVDNEPSPPPMLPLHGLHSMFDTIDYLIVQNGYQCAACPDRSRSFPDMPALRRHMVRHVTGDELRCNHCNRVFEDIESLRKHLLDALSAEYGGGKSDSEDDGEDDGADEGDVDSVIYIVKDGRLTCSACDAVFGPVTRWNKEKFKLHVGEKHWTPSSYKCDECGKRFSNVDKLEKHIQRHAESMEVGWMGSQPSTSSLATIKAEEQDPIDSTFDALDIPQDPMGLLSEMPEVQVKVEVQDEATHDYAIEAASNSDASYRNSSSDSDSSESDCDRGKKRKKKIKAKKSLIKKHALSREIAGGKEGSIILACRLCDEGFLLQELLDRHMVQKHDDRERPFKCSKCSKTYLTNGNLQEHFRMAHSGIKFSCKECGIKFATKSSWKRHMQGHTEEGFCCDICKQKFTSHTVLTKHKRRVHENLAKNFICLDCGSTFDDNASLREHRVRHTNERRWECETCGMKFKRNHNLMNHRKTHLAENQPVPTIECLQCDEKFLTKMALASHRYVHGKYCCKICKLSFETQSGLMQHRKDDHKLIKHTGTECRSCHEKFQNSEELLKHREEAHANDPMLECDICKARYHSPAALRSHQRYHDRVILYDCQNCPESFNSQLLLDRHLKDVHKDEKNYICDLCGKGFPTKKQIAAHLIRHRNPRKKHYSCLPGCYICDFCGKEFRFQMTMKRHVFNAHTNQNTFKCDQCDKVLASLEGLKLHLRSHSQDQSIMCELCGRSFPQPYRLKVHMESHMRAGNEYRCHICNRSCREPKKLEKHMQLHTGETQYSCTLCQRFFVTKRHQKLHMIRVHQTEVKCLRCEKMFPSAKKMRLHIKIHDHPDYMECPKCFTCVKDKKTMGRHMKQHENEGIRVPCQYCPLTFVTKKTRRKHERTMHSDEIVQVVGHQMVDEDDEGGDRSEEEADADELIAEMAVREDETNLPWHL